MLSMRVHLYNVLQIIKLTINKACICICKMSEKLTLGLLDKMSGQAQKHFANSVLQSNAIPA